MQIVEMITDSPSASSSFTSGNLPKMAPGQRYSLLTSVKFIENAPNSTAIWLFVCDCGRSKTARASCVRSGKLRSCGCVKRDPLTRFGRHVSTHRTRARAEGETRYNTGKPCHQGHHSDRWTCSGDCIQCERSRPHEKNRQARGYGLADWNAVLQMKEEQNGRCAICSDPLETTKNTHIDHCHKSKFVRGLLCRTCNQGLGFFADDPDRLRAATAYLERSKRDH